MMTASPESAHRSRGRLDRPLFQALRRIGVLDPMLRAYRRMSDFRRRKRALQGQGLVPERDLKDCFRRSLTRLRARNPDGAIGDYLEFGVCYGSSMACMHDVLVETGEHDVRLFGFDSFEGLPANARNEDTGHWTPGQFRCSLGFAQRLLASRKVDASRAVLIKGWYEDTLTPSTVAELGLGHAAVIMIDCDLYSSTVVALKFCAPLIRDHAVLIFDDWNSLDLAAQNLGERRAFQEFLQQHPEFETEELQGYGLAAVFLVSRRGMNVINGPFGQPR